MQTRIHDDGQRPRGRPPGPPERSRREQVGFRTTPDVKNLLDKLAAESGRSVSQEMELRLLRSIEADSDLGGPQCAALFRSMASLAKIAVGDPGQWFTDHEAFMRLRDLWIRVIESAAPPKPDPTQEFSKIVMNGIELSRDPTLDTYQPIIRECAEKMAGDPIFSEEQRAHIQEVLAVHFSNQNTFYNASVKQLKTTDKK